MTQPWVMRSIDPGYVPPDGGAARKYFQGRPVADDEVTRAYPPPAYLKDLQVYATTVEEADDGLVYIGYNARGERRYVYGKNVTERRARARAEIVLDVHAKLPRLRALVEDCWLHGDDRRRRMGVLMELELLFWIRTGKLVYSTANGTSGLLTLRKQHVVGGRLRFTGKARVKHDFVIADPITRRRLAWCVRTAPGDFVFSDTEGPPSESYFYEFNRANGVRLKDLRTYGANLLFLAEVYARMPLARQLESALADAAQDTADHMGHTKGVFKRSYLIPDLGSYIYPNDRAASREAYVEEVLERVRLGLSRPT